jgi:multicomponent Na+:H+ antiporter subunit G
MIDVIAGIAVVLGSLLALLGAIGLIRFPDVFTRIHAAAKASTMGVILATLAAALEAETFAALALLLLVAALLFLSAPLGTSLLARAAYHDTETSRILDDRDDLADPPTAMLRTEAVDRPGAASLLLGWLAVIWIALFASGTPGVLLGAFLVGVVVTLLLPGYRPRWPEGLFDPVAFIRFVGTTVSALVSANFDMARATLSRRAIRPAILRVPLRVATQTEIALLMNVTTFTPGTVALELRGRDLFVHVMDLRTETEFRETFEKVESRIIDAFGTARERRG